MPEQSSFGLTNFLTSMKQKNECIIKGLVFLEEMYITHLLLRQRVELGSSNDKKGKSYDHFGQTLWMQDYTTCVSASSTYTQMYVV